MTDRELNGFIELPNGAMLVDNQASAALANVAVYALAFSHQLQIKAAERGIDTDDMTALAAVGHIANICADASVKHAKLIGDEVRRTAFEQGVQPNYHIMSGNQALAVEGEMLEMALAGAMPTVPDGGIPT